LRDHPSRRCLHAEECTLEVHADDVVEIPFRDVEEFLLARNPGVVDHDVQPAKGFGGGGDKPVDRRRPCRCHAPRR